MNHQLHRTAKMKMKNPVHKALWQVFSIMILKFVQIQGPVVRSPFSLNGG